MLVVQCSKSCQGGSQVRQVECIHNGTMAPDSECDEDMRPNSQQPCNEHILCTRKSVKMYLCMPNQNMNASVLNYILEGTCILCGYYPHKCMCEGQYADKLKCMHSVSSQLLVSKLLYSYFSLYSFRKFQMCLYIYMEIIFLIHSRQCIGRQSVFSCKM